MAGNAPSGNTLLPSRLLHAAIKQVPAVRYALGVGGIAAVVAIVLTGWKLEAQSAVFGTLIVFVFMVVLVIFAALSKTGPATLRPLALFLAWAFLVLTIAVAGLFVSCAFFDRPKTLPCLLRGDCVTVLSPTSPSAAMAIQLRKRGLLIEPTTTGLDILFEKGRAGERPEFAFTHVPEQALVVQAIETDPFADDAARAFVRRWKDEESSIGETLIRFYAAFPKGASLVSSDRTVRTRAAIGEKVQQGNGIAVLGGEDGLRALQANIDNAVTDDREIRRIVIEASRKYLVLALTNLYAMTRSAPGPYLEKVDPDYRQFLDRIPDNFAAMAMVVGYDGSAAEPLVFECGGPGFYSRFAVPLTEITDPSVVAQMRTGPWPIGPPQTYFAEWWWVRNAVWQMLAREHGSFRDKLEVRIQKYDACGPP